MRQAHRILENLHSPGRYTGSFWPGGHVFTAEMQDEAIGFLAASLALAAHTSAS
jgi:hypothetical protein